MLIEIHMIQNHSPANLNRDDLGAPKTCIFGGVTRARISSQCLKRSIRNPGNPDDVHNRGPGIFAEALGEHIGIRSKLFPWLVEQELKQSSIPENDHARIVMAAQRIATSKGKEQKGKAQGDKDDKRPKTPQLISFGRGDAKRFVAKLVELRQPGNGGDGTSDRYAYFLNPVVGFQEMVREQLDDPALDEKLVEKIVKASWVIAKCRMSQLPEDEAEASDNEDDKADPSPTTPDVAADGQPGAAVAQRIAKAMTSFALLEDQDGKKKFKDLTKGASTEEKGHLKEDAPDKPKRMDDFIGALREALRCNAVDFALFGRMTTSDAFEDVEAAMQVAHAISTHAVVNEVDYWTAVDDLGNAGGGSGHLGEGMFNSACFYKYSCLDWDQFVRNLAGPEPDREKDAEARKKWMDEIKPQAKRLAACALGHFIRAAAMTTPSGKQNSFASHTEPCGILVEIKKHGKHPTSYANAFAEPVERIGKPDDDGPDAVSLEGRTIAQLGDHVFNLRRAHGIESTVLWHAMPLYRYPLQGWEREADGRKAKVRDANGEPTKVDKPPVQFADKMFAAIGGNGRGEPGLVEAVIEAIGLDWNDVKDAGKTKPSGAAS